MIYMLTKSEQDEKKKIHLPYDVAYIHLNGASEEKPKDEADM